MALSKDWTHDELLGELRRRERAAASKDRSRGVATPPGRSRNLANVPTSDLTRAVRDRQRVVYGVDNRRDLYQVTAASIRRAADAVVALVKASDLTKNADGTFALETESYQRSYDLCGSEPFVSQPIGCFCSGFLVATDVIVTAGHCVTNAADLARIRFVFGFRMQDATTPRTRFGADDVYAGKTLIGRRLSADGTDWAVVRLDRAVNGRAPVAVRTSGRIGSAARVFVIGHPCGLPQKYAAGATVRDNTPGPYFIANLDTYGGNSGSPVFNAQTNKVEGILVRGETDFVSNGECSVSLVCPSTGCRGEDVTRASVWIGKIPAAPIRTGGPAPRTKRRTAVSATGKERRRGARQSRTA
jgi:hypothetical protein